MARPSRYNNKLAKKILNLYASGYTLLQIGKIKGMPSRWSVYRWRKDNAEFDRSYTLACECASDEIIEEALQKVMSAAPRDAKLVDVQFKSASWYVAKMNRSKYGDKIDIDITKTLDISPALAEAIKRMAAIPGNGQKILNVPCEIIA